MQQESATHAAALTPPGESVGHLAGKYMIFKLNGETFGLQIIKVREIIGMMGITPVPQSSPLIRGVINLRGKIEPVLDLRAKFNMAAVEPTDQTVIIVIQYVVGKNQQSIGVIVDEVIEVMSIYGEEIEPTPRFSAIDEKGNFLLGVAKHEQRVVFLLDIDRILDCEEVSQIRT